MKKTDRQTDRDAVRAMDRMCDPFDRTFNLPIMEVGHIPEHYTRIEKERQVLNQLKQLKEQWLREDPTLQNIDPKYVLLNGMTLEQFGFRYILRHHTKRYRRSSSSS